MLNKSRAYFDEFYNDYFESLIGFFARPGGKTPSTV